MGREIGVCLSRAGNPDELPLETEFHEVKKEFPKPESGFHHVYNENTDGEEIWICVNDLPPDTTHICFWYAV